MIVTIDHEKCSKDLKCVDECPTRIFTFSKEKKKVDIVENHEDICIKCGHCVAVCPEGAIKMPFFPEKSFLENDREDLLTEKNIEYILRSRRSIRSYKKSPVPKDKIQELLNIASCAPTGHNSRCVEWMVVYEEEKIKKVISMVIDWMKYLVKESPETAQMLNLENVILGYEMGMDPILRGAPHLIISHASKLAPTAAIDCATAVSYIEIAAPSFGLGTCWAGFFNIAATMWPPLKKELNLPKGNNNFASVMIGLPKHNYSKVIKREPGKITWA